MSTLKLVNNTGLKTERNLCYVNASLQLLFSLKEFRDFFKSYQYKLNYQEKMPVCEELSRIFRTDGRFRTTAAELRRLVRNHYNRLDINDGMQQDLEEFHRMILEMLEKELSNAGLPASMFVKKFWGRQQERKKFVDSKEGLCNKGHQPRIEEENFMTIKLDVPSTHLQISLNDMMHNYFSEGTSLILMKCSDCCKHSRDCPQNGDCKLKGATIKRNLVTAPTYLYIQLLRFSNFQSPKTETKVMPENELVLPNQERYTLISIANHLGYFIGSGHYQALIKCGTKWTTADDEAALDTCKDKEINGNNYIFVYQKTGSTIQLKPNESNKTQSFNLKEIETGKKRKLSPKSKINVCTEKQEGKIQKIVNNLKEGMEENNNNENIGEKLRRKN